MVSVFPDCAFSLFEYVLKERDYLLPLAWAGPNPQGSSEREEFSSMTINGQRQALLTYVGLSALLFFSFLHGMLPPAASLS